MAMRPTNKGQVEAKAEITQEMAADGGQSRGDTSRRNKGKKHSKALELLTGKQEMITTGGPHG